MRLSRAALALLVLITMVVGMHSAMRTRVRDDAIAAVAFDDDLTSPPAIELEAFTLSPPVVSVSIIERARAENISVTTRVAVLAAAPKTSPPAPRS